MTEVETRLAEWLRDLDLHPAADRQAAIATAARSLAETATPREMLGLAVVAHKEPDPASDGRVAEAIQSADGTWAVRADDAAARRTAAIAVAMAMEGDATASVTAALCVRSAEFLGMSPELDDLKPLAEAALVRTSEVERGRSDLTAAIADIKGAFKAVPKMDEGDGALTDHVSAVAKAAQAAATRAAAVTDDSLPPVTRRFKALEEEVDLLWWLLGEYSQRADSTFKTVPKAAAPCVLALDFGDLVQFPCPPRGTRALLSRALGGRAAQPTELGQAVAGTNKLLGSDWIPADVDNHRLLPVLSAAREHGEFGGKAAWTESIARWRIDPAREATSLDLAEQLVGERLLASMVR